MFALSLIQKNAPKGAFFLSVFFLAADRIDQAVDRLTEIFHGRLGQGSKIANMGLSLLDVFLKMVHFLMLHFVPVFFKLRLKTLKQCPSFLNLLFEGFPVGLVFLHCRHGRVLLCSDNNQQAGNDEEYPGNIGQNDPLATAGNLRETPCGAQGNLPKLWYAIDKDNGTQVKKQVHQGNLQGKECMAA